MTDVEDRDHTTLIVDFVDNPKIAHANPPAFTAAKFLAIWGAGREPA